MIPFWKSAVAATLLTFGTTLTGCQSKPAEQAATPETSAASAADSTALPTATAAYICPMGCEGSASDKPGKCPVCDMDLEPNPAAKAGTAL
ncbi:hypothetical protein K3G63_14975 [Hymenobacter sp. HSC-4F20]|uniref:heavy metal-binding domain-containing protein n=1 Tax=Hymenobacter sp. HSC-4F20 TaxID=2864135 RepID=UPI001C737CE9|nr:heavy metal-binding domain-containing protein [Hymenobacter sp. HSC-4F20]MBX0291752.1 hypothetical protein [Hymenobacter sp. HSC-4F20]